MIYIGIADLVANALIELVENTGSRQVFFKDLDEYGAMVVKYLNDKNEQAVLLLSKEQTNEFLHDYSDLFEFFTEGISEGIKLKDDVTVERLWEKFRGYLSVDVMMAFMDSVAISKLGVENCRGQRD